MQTVTRLTSSFIPTHYNLTLSIDREAKRFSGTVAMHGASLNDGSFSVHSKDLAIDTVLVDGQAVKYAFKPNDELEIFHDKLLAGKHVAVIAFSGELNDQMHGMYPCYYQHDGATKQLIATQFESHHAREVFPCIDEPDAKATYDVTILTEKNVTVLGNMPIAEQHEENDMLATTFATTPKMSSYLLAWVYGDLHKKSAMTSSGVEVNVWATPAQSPASLDFALDIAVRTIDFFDEYFGTPYPLPKSDHVALPDFSAGAMENWGLITYREVALLAEPGSVSVSSKHRIAAVIAHELSHQWFGNLVTMKWWNNLWLNESFANLMEYIALDALHPEWNIWLDFAGYETVSALRRDSIDGVQAVQVDVNHPDEISTLFDPAIVYAKGARLLRMLEQYIGKEDFRTGLQQYFAAHAYQNTEETDLWLALSKASGKDIASFMTPWVTQPGFPVVTVSGSGLTQQQFFVGPHDSKNRLWPIALNANDKSLPVTMEESTVVLDLPLKTRLNVGDTAHFITQYETDYLKAILDSFETLEPVDRLQLLHEQTLLARGGAMSSAELIPLLNVYSSETAESVWDIIAVAIGELKKFVEGDEAAESALRTFAGTMAKGQYQALGWTATADESESQTKLRATILGLMCYSEDTDVIEHAKKLFKENEINELEPEIRSLVISMAVRHGGDSALIDRLLNLYATTSSADLQQDICAGLCSTRDPETIQKLIQQMTNANMIRNQDLARWFVYLIRNRDSRRPAWSWMQNNWAWIEQTFSGDKSYDDFPRYSAMGMVSRDLFNEYVAFFKPMEAIPALSRVITIAIAEIEGRLELIERDTQAVRERLLNL